MLEGNLVNLRVLEREDLPLIAQWANDPKFGGEFESFEQVTLQELEKWYETLHSDEKWFIIEEKDGAKIGQIMHIPRGCHFRIGYVVVPEKRGKGYCTEAVQILVDYLFLSRDIVRIEAEVSPENRASQRVLEKANFTREGLIRKSVYARGKWHDGVIFSILREEWKEPHLLNLDTFIREKCNQSEI
ncbi:MAG: GNAT family N-acetyltransferase [Theionarchaea archaeon]|nr:GNAT family N-acetyltransferase [Theionarchaea archaeon]